MHADRRPNTRARGTLLVVACALVLAGCNAVPKANPTSSRGEMPDQEVTDFVLTETDAGRPEWTLYANWAATYTVRNVVVARDIRVDFFDDTGARSSELTARQGEIQQLTRDMTARGNVVLLTTEGTRMTTEELHFSNERQLITSDTLVRIERPGETLQAVGFTSDPALKHFEFRTKVTATVHSQAPDLTPSHGKHK